MCLGCWTPGRGRGDSLRRAVSWVPESWRGWWPLNTGALGNRVRLVFLQTKVTKPEQPWGQKPGALGSRVR